MSSLEEVFKFTRKNNISVTINFVPEVNAFRIGFRKMDNSKAMEVKFGQAMIDSDCEDLVAYALEKAENEMVKSNKSIGELIDD